MKAIQDRIKNTYGLEAASIKALVGEVNKNYLITSDQGLFIYKETPADPETSGFTIDETHLLSVLAKKIPGSFQKPLAGKDGQFIYDGPEGGYQFRVMKYLEGEVLHDVNYTEKLLSSFGKLLAKMDIKLQKEDCPHIRSRRYHWDNLHFDLNIQNRQYIVDPADRKLVDYYHLQFHEKVIPLLPDMRFSLIHNDTNDYNVIVRDGIVQGLIDLGDSVYSLLINELAVALSYVMLDNENPLELASYLIRAYNELLPLQESEVDLLYYLIGTRLSISLLHSAHGAHKHPENEYLLISQAPVIRMLHKWISIGPVAASLAFRKAAALPNPKGPNIKEQQTDRDRYLGKNLSLTYNEPLFMEQAAFQYMYDAEGRSFLDLRNNIPHVGHAHPRVVMAGQKAMARLNTNTRYLYEGIHSYSKKLLDYFPKKLSKVFYVNSGSAATDLALRLARNHTGRQKMLVMAHAYHGNTQAAIDVSHYKFSGKGGAGTPDESIVVPIPKTDSSLVKETLHTINKTQIQDFIKELSPSGSKIAGFISEPIVSAAGQVVIDKDYTQSITQFVKEQDGVYIVDEVQTGFGRLGTHFWAFEQSEVVPDIVILGKPIANGHPMAAVVCTEEIAHSFNNGMEFFSSFGGNPVSCAIAEAMLSVMEEEELTHNAKIIGSYLIDELTLMRAEYPAIADIRGSGLSLGIELLDKSDPVNPQNPGTELARKLCEKMKEHLILVGTDGPFNNVLKLKPPLCFNQENAGYFLSALRECLSV